MGFFSSIGSKVKSTPAKQSAKTTSITNVLSSVISGVTKAVKTVASAVSKAVTTAAEAAKKKAAAEAAAKKKPQTTNKPNAPAATSSTPSANKNDLISWGDNRFFATASHVRSFKGLQINTSCATEDEENGGDKYVKKKNNGGYEVKFTAILDKRLGESDVRKVALHLAEVARTGAKNYIYCSGSKLFTPQMMGTGASIKNIVTAPNGTWISCEVDLTLKQCSKGDGSTGPSSGGGGGGGGGGYKYSVTVYYSGSSGAISSVTGYSNVSKEDARKKAWAKVPGNAQWASETKKQATNQTTNAKNTANNTTNNAKKDASKYVNDKVNSVKNNNTTKVTTTKPNLKIQRLVK